jgi:hypothetical protein
MSPTGEARRLRVRLSYVARSDFADYPLFPLHSKNAQAAEQKGPLWSSEATGSSDTHLLGASAARVERSGR